MEAKVDKATVSTIMNVGLNLAALPNEFLHTLQEGVIEEELKAQEQHALSTINEKKVNNEQIFIEKITTLKAWKKVQEKNEHTIVVVAKACKTIPELHIPEEEPVEAKIRKLAAGV